MVSLANFYGKVNVMATVEEQLKTFSDSVTAADIPEELKQGVLTRLSQLSGLIKSPTFLPEFDRINKYIEWILSLPWNKRSEDNLDLVNAKKILDETHFGLEDIKSRILEYVSTMSLKKKLGEGDDIYRAPILCFVGLVGTGKTTIASSIAKAMGRNFARIPFGGMGDPLDLRGQSRMHAEAEPGRVMRALRNTQTRNCVILLDEIDRVTDEGRSSIMGVLVELLDPEQNKDFVDHYIDFPFNLSEVLFIATANNTHHISTAVLDRLEPIHMPSYSDAEKIMIGKEYMLPEVIKLSGVPKEAVNIDEAVWHQIVRPLGFDAGMRTLERTITGMIRKIAREMVEGKGEKFNITTENVKNYLPR